MDSYRKLTEAELKELRAMIDEALHAYSKADAKAPLRRLQTHVDQLRPQLEPYFSSKLGRIVSEVQDASGQVSDKHRKIEFIDQDWSVFENGVIKD